MFDDVYGFLYIGERAFFCRSINDGTVITIKREETAVIVIIDSNISIR